MGADSVSLLDRRSMVDGRWLIRGSGSGLGSGLGLIRSALVGHGDLPTCCWRGRVKGEKPSLRHPWLRSPLGLSLPSRQIGAGIINPVQTPIWPLTILRLVYAGCRESPGLRDSLHRPGATRHPWRDAPSYGHPDRAPAPFTPPPGPADGTGLGDPCIKPCFVCIALVGWR